eukprot:3380440-Pyramimonas_sp.AAC.1
MTKGAVVTFENPLMSHLFFLLECSCMMGFDGFEVVRSDHCPDGAPYQNLQVFAGNTPALKDIGRLCNHVKHQVMLTGAMARRSA